MKIQFFGYYDEKIKKNFKNDWKMLHAQGWPHPIKCITWFNMLIIVVKQS